MKYRIVLLLVCLFGASPWAFAEKIYKWVDSDGNVHYSAQPGGKQAQELKIHTLPAPPAAPAATPAESPQPSFVESYEKEQKEKAAAAEKAAKEKEVRDKNCEIVRKHMISLQLGGRLYEIDENGERKFLSDEEIQSRLEQAKKDVAKWCQ